MEKIPHTHSPTLNNRYKSIKSKKPLKDPYATSSNCFIEGGVNKKTLGGGFVNRCLIIRPISSLRF